MEQKLLAQGTGRNGVVNVYPDRIELRTGWNNENVDPVGLKQIAHVSIRGFVNCALTLEVNDGRRILIEHMALPDARQVKTAIEDQKRKASLYE